MYHPLLLSAVTVDKRSQVDLVTFNNMLALHAMFGNASDGMGAADKVFASNRLC